MKPKLKVLVLFDINEPVPADYDYRPDLESGNFPTERDVVEVLEGLGHTVRPLALFAELRPLLDAVQAEPPDLIFNLTEMFQQDRRHEPHLAGLLDLLKFPYTGTGPTSLALCKHKGLAKKVLTYHRIKTPHFVMSPRRRPLKHIAHLRFPVFVKPTATESSVGIAQAALAEDERSALERVAFIHDSIKSDALVEEYIEGREIYGGVLGNDRLKTLPLVELFVGDAPLGDDETPAGAPRFFTYRAKWDEAYRKKWGIGSGPPRELDPALEKKLRHHARRACQALQVGGYGRVDMRLTEKGEVHVIEVNPNPGLAKDEDFAQAAKRAGLPYPKLIQRIVSLALARVP